jgi:D-alanyl-D-alanine dipeptidase
MRFSLNFQAFLLLFFVLGLSAPKAQNSQSNPYGLPLTSTLPAYLESLKSDPDLELVNLETFIPGIVLDIRYATSNNFTHKTVYTEPRAFLRKPAAAALKQVQNDLIKQGYVLKVFDAYRPYAATLVFWEIVKDTLFVASPAKGSRHNRGCAVDVTLVSPETGLEVEMPTPFDDFSEKASPSYTGMTPGARDHLDILITAMSKHGFTVLPSEWWHYDFTGWQQCGLMDIPFSDLGIQP